VLLNKEADRTLFGFNCTLEKGP